MNIKKSIIIKLAFAKFDFLNLVDFLIFLVFDKFSAIIILLALLIILLFKKLGEKIFKIKMINIIILLKSLIKY